MIVICEVSSAGGLADVELEGKVSACASEGAGMLACLVVGGCKPSEKLVSGLWVLPWLSSTSPLDQGTPSSPRRSLVQTGLVQLH